MHIFLLLDSIENYQYLFRISVDTITQHLNVIVKNEILLVFLPQLLDLLQSIVLRESLLQIVDLEVEIEEFTVADCEFR